MNREAWRAAIHGVAKSRTRLSDRTELNWAINKSSILHCLFALLHIVLMGCLLIYSILYVLYTFLSYSFNVWLILWPVCLFSCSVLILHLSHIGSKEPLWKFYWQYQESLDQSGGKLTDLWYWALPINILGLIFHSFRSSLISFS